MPEALSYDKAGKLAVKDVKLTLILIMGQHRGEGDMEAWLPMEVNATAQPQKGVKWKITDFSIINRITLNYNVISKLTVTSRRFPLYKSAQEYNPELTFWISSVITSFVVEGELLLLGLSNDKYNQISFFGV